LAAPSFYKEKHLRIEYWGMHVKIKAGSNVLVLFGQLPFANCYLLECLQLKHKSQRLRANGQEPPFSHTPATYPDDGIQSRSAAFPALQVIGGRGNL
jgi:hypothetical protein